MSIWAYSRLKISTRTSQPTSGTRLKPRKKRGKSDCGSVWSRSEETQLRSAGKCRKKNARSGWKREEFNRKIGDK